MDPLKMKNQPSTNNKVVHIVRWVLSVFLIILALGAFAGSDIPAAIFILLASVFASPIVIEKIDTRRTIANKNSMTTVAKVLLVAIPFVIGLMVSKKQPSNASQSNLQTANNVTSSPDPVISEDKKDVETGIDSAAYLRDRARLDSLDKIATAREQITQKLKRIAARDWPNDYTTQEYWINQQLSDYEYMLTIPNDPIKRQAERDWPLDFSTQKYWYNEQLEAKERLEK